MLYKKSLTSALLTSSQMRQQVSTSLSEFHKIKCPLTCKKDKKHSAFDLIFICLEKECSDNMKPICAQCLHEQHSGHEIKLIKEIAEIGESFVQSEKGKEQVSPYWKQLSEQYHHLTQELGGLIDYLSEYRSTLKKVHEEFFGKLNKEKEMFWEQTLSTSQDILRDRCSSGEELQDKIKLIIQSVQIDEPAKPKYKFNVLKEETVLLVMENFKSIEFLVQQTRDFVFSTLEQSQIIESYGAAEFRITEGEDYLKIISLEGDQKELNHDLKILEIEDEPQEFKQRKAKRDSFFDDEENEAEEEKDGDEDDEEFEQIGGETPQQKKEEKNDELKFKEDHIKIPQNLVKAKLQCKEEEQSDEQKDSTNREPYGQYFKRKYTQNQQNKGVSPLKNSPYLFEQAQYRFKFDEIQEDTLERELTQAQEKLKRLRDNFENRNSSSSFPYPAYPQRSSNPNYQMSLQNSELFPPKSAASSLGDHWHSTQPMAPIMKSPISIPHSYGNLQDQMRQKANNQFTSDFSSHQSQFGQMQHKSYKNEMGYGMQYKQV